MAKTLLPQPPITRQNQLNLRTAAFDYLDFIAQFIEFDFIHKRRNQHRAFARSFPKAARILDTGDQALTKTSPARSRTLNTASFGVTNDRT